MISNGKSAYLKRIFIIQSIIKLAIYLLKGSFTNCLENEKNINVPILGNKDEIKYMSQSNNYLLKDIHGFVSFNKNDLSLFFFMKEKDNYLV